MKFFRTKFTCFFLASLMLFVSCSQNSSDLIEENQNLNYQNTNASSAKYSKYDRLLTDQEIVQIGIDHNANLALLIQNNPRSINDVNNTALNLYSEKGIDQEILDKYAIGSDSVNTDLLIKIIDYVKDDFVDSDLLKSKIIEIKGINNVSALKQHETDTRKILKGIDLDTYLVACTVYQHSLTFWENHFPNSTESARGGWKEADGISASIGFLTMAAAFAAISAVGIATGGTGVIPTIGIVAGLLEIGAQSALASIYAVIR